MTSSDEIVTGTRGCIGGAGETCRRRRLLRVGGPLLGFVVSWALALGVLAPGTANALSNHFTVSNYSSYKLRLDSITTPPAWFADVAFVNKAEAEGRPPDGAVLDPGATDGYEVTYFFLAQNAPEANYSILDTAGHQVGWFYVAMNVTGARLLATNCQVAGRAGGPFQEDIQAPAGLDCTGEGDNSTSVALVEAPGTVHNISPSLKQQQADYLRTLCANSSAAACHFTANKQEHLESPGHQVGGFVSNPYDTELKTTIKLRDTIGSSDSVEVGIKAGGKLFEIIDVEVEAKYGHEWTQEHEFGQEVEATVPPGKRCWFTATAPIIRYTGDFKVTMANSTWNLTDVYFDGPDTTSQAASWGYRLNCESIPPADRRRTPAPRPGTKLVLRGRYKTEGAASSEIAQPRLRLSIVGPSTRRPGGRADFAVLLRSERSLGTLTHALGDVRLRVAVRDRVVRRWLVRGPALGLGRTRKFQFAARVPSRGVRSVCVRAKATARRAITGQATHCLTVGGRISR
jgi:hypothetical protein